VLIEVERRGIAQTRQRKGRDLLPSWGVSASGGKSEQAPFIEEKWEGRDGGAVVDTEKSPDLSKIAQGARLLEEEVKQEYVRRDRNISCVYRAARKRVGA